MKRIAVMIIGVAMMLMMALAMTGCGKNDAQTLEHTRPQVTTTQKADDAKKVEAAKKAEEAKKLEAAKKAEEAKKVEAAKKAEEAKKVEAAKKAEEAKKVEAAKKAEEAKKLEAAKKAEEAKKLEAAKQAEEAKRLEEAKKAEEAQKAAEAQNATVAQQETTTVQTLEYGNGSPVQRFAGTYVCDRCSVEVIGESNNTVRIKVCWSNSAFDRVEWVMSGNFAEGSTYVCYKDCVSSFVSFNEDGTLKSSRINYVDGKGTLIFNGNTMTWVDLTGHIADGMTFTKLV